MKRKLIYRIWTFCFFLAFAQVSLAQNVKLFPIHFGKGWKDSVEICGGDLIEFVHDQKNSDRYSWNWDLGDGTISVLDNGVKHLFQPDKTNNYEVLVTNDSVEWSVVIYVNVVGNDLGLNVKYDTIYCEGQQAAIEIEDYRGIYHIMPGSNYTVINEFNKNGVALLRFTETGQSNIGLYAQIGGCQSKMQIPYLCAGSNFMGDLGQISLIPKNMEGPTYTLIVLGEKIQSDLNNMSFEWGLFKKSDDYSSGVEPLGTSAENYYVFDEKIDTSENIYFVKVLCESCNSCNTTLFYPGFK